MIGNNDKYDLEDRTFRFAKDIRLFVKSLKNTLANVEDGRQLIRSSGSIGANYIEANEGFSTKDFVYRAKISRKEAKESVYWLKLIKATNGFDDSHKVQQLIEEANELKKIMSAIINKFDRRGK